MTALATSTTILDANLRALSRGSGRTVALLRNATPRIDVEFLRADDGAMTATVGVGGSARLLASKRTPRREAELLASQLDVAAKPVVVVMGFGLGHHVAAVAARLKKTGLIVVFEPDLGLLRAVLEAIDHSEWIGSTNMVILTDAADRGAMAAALRDMEAVVALGVELLEHPPSRARLGTEAGRFHKHLAQVIEAVKMAVVTTMVRMPETLLNKLMNMDRYATGPGLSDLTRAAPGRPAIVVSAGPSLERNVHLLTDPRVRDRFVIIATQTVLKPLLARGIRPHFVTALDYADIGRRFYEGLTDKDVAGITLVVEPKVNAAVLDAFPGTIRCNADKFLDTVLGSRLARPNTELPLGATVAHLAYYLARHLECDPVVFIGQDLGFTDGQYYASGAAIHGVWAGELNAFNTLEMMEWQRIKRMGHHLRRAADTRGRTIYTDEQMCTYLVQFERDFKTDTERGLTIIDATEGGVAKAFTQAEPLADVIRRWADAPGEPLRLPEPRMADVPSLRAVAGRVADVRRAVGRVGDMSRKAAGLLRQMIEHHQDQARVNRLIGRVDEIRDHVMKLVPAFDLVQYLNQTGGFNRQRADRSIHMDESLSPLDRQRRQIERDLTNVTWLADAADDLGRMLDDCLVALDGGPKRTRDPVTPAEMGTGSMGPAVQVTNERLRVAAVIPVNPERTPLDLARDLGAPVALGRNALRLTLERLARCRRLDGALIVTHDVERAKALLGGRVPGLKIEFAATEAPPLAWRAPALRGSRLWAGSCWRAGIGGMTCFDEVCDGAPMAAAMERHGIDAALLVGPDWCLVDPALCDAVIERCLEQPTVHRLTFSQAPPGLAGCVIMRSLMQFLARSQREAGPLGSIGSLLGYLPVAPVPDTIAEPMCATVEPAVRDAQARFIIDSAPGHTLLARAVAALGDGLLDAPARALVDVIATETNDEPAPAHLILQVCGESPVCLDPLGLGGGAKPGRAPVMPPDLTERIITEYGAARDDAALTIGGPCPGAGDPLAHPHAIKILTMARRAAVAGVHLRTNLLCEPSVVEAILDAEPDVVSVDLWADTPATYQRVTGVDGFARARGNLERLLAGRTARHGPGTLPTPWIVPRIARCDAAYEDIEPFYDRWIMAAGAAVIDPLPGQPAGARLTPLPKPPTAAHRDWRQRMFVLTDGTVPARELAPRATPPFGTLADQSVPEAWARLLAHRRAIHAEHGDSHLDLVTGY